MYTKFSSANKEHQDNSPLWSNVHNGRLKVVKIHQENPHLPPLINVKVRDSNLSLEQTNQTPLLHWPDELSRMQHFVCPEQ